MPLRIMLADDNNRLRTKVRLLLESRPGWRVVAEAADGREAVLKAQYVQPDVLVLDYSMPMLDGVSAIPQIRQAAPQAEIVMLTVHDAQFTIGRAVEAGARGYVVKSQIFKDLLPAVEAASEHRTYLSFLDDGKERIPKQTPRGNTSER